MNLNIFNPTSSDPANTQVNVVNIYDIYGVERGSTKISDHPKYTNPRQKPNEDTTSLLSESLAIDDAILIYTDPSVEGKFVLLDGKTRLIARLMYISRNPDDSNAEYIKAEIFEGTDVEAKISQISRNLPLRKADLSDQEIVVSLRTMIKEHNLSKEEVKHAFRWYGVAGTRAYNKYTSLLQLDQDVFDKFVMGKISVNSALATIDQVPQEKKQAFLEASEKCKDVGDKVLEEVTGVKLTNKVSKISKVDVVKELKQDLVYALADLYNKRKKIANNDIDEYIKYVLKDVSSSKNIDPIHILLDENALCTTVYNYLAFLKYPNIDTIEEAITTIYEEIFTQVDKSADRTIKKVIDSM
jgi:hypothetical protein